MAQFKKLTLTLRALVSALSGTGLYCAWQEILRATVLTLMTYFLMGPRTRLQDISEVSSANELLVVGYSALAFLLITRRFYPLLTMIPPGQLSPTRVLPQFIPTFLRGLLLGFTVAAVYVAADYYEYVGAFMQVDETISMLLSISVRSFAIISMVIAEEYLLRKIFLNRISNRVSPVYASALSALAFALLKSFQFDLSWMQLITLTLIGFLLSLRCLAEGDFLKGAGLWAGLLVAFHPLLGLPIFGNEFSGVFVIQFQNPVDTLGYGGSRRLISILTGGIGGPLSSFALQLVLTIYVARVLWKHRKKLLMNADFAR